MKFAHLADCHLGAWRHPQLQELNMQSFSMAIDTCIREKVDFILISGDLFDSAYPSIEILKETFSEFRKLREAKIPCYIIAGSHDYSVSGKSFLDVLEKAGFCKNVFRTENRENKKSKDNKENRESMKGENEKNENKDEKIILNPILDGNIALYGYPGKKSSLEIDELRKIKLQDCPGLFRIFMLHTSIKDAIGRLPIDSIDEKELPEADYYALGHLHVDYCKDRFVYAGPIFPNNFQELEELKCGRFYIVELKERNVVEARKIELKLKDTIAIKIEIENALTATEKIINELGRHDITDKIVLLKLHGKLKQGKISDIKFSEIENFTSKKNVFAFLKSTSQIVVEEPEIKIDVSDMNILEDSIIKKYIEEKPSKFNNFVSQIINALDLEKQEGEKKAVFETRLLTDIKKILNF